MFPLNSLDHVVPPSLHVMLGVVLVLYKLLLAECQKLDVDQGAEIAESQERKALNQEWEISSEKLQDSEKELRNHSRNVLYMLNLNARFEAILDNNKKENEDLVAASTSGKRMQSEEMFLIANHLCV